MPRRTQSLDLHDRVEYDAPGMPRECRQGHIIVVIREGDEYNYSVRFDDGGVMREIPEAHLTKIGDV